jgi:methylmalonyl-CoA decarboxylase
MNRLHLQARRFGNSSRHAYYSFCRCGTIYRTTCYAQGMNLVSVEIKRDIGVLTLNNPAKRNALSDALIGAVIAGLGQLEQAEARVAILRAPRGSKVFSAGHDVNELPEPGRDPLTYHDPLLRVIDAIRRFSAPVLAMVEGTVWGGACELVFCCDMIFSTPDVTFAITPAKLGVPYNASGVLHLMNALPQNLLKEMLFTAAPMSCQSLAELGVVNQIVPAEKLEAAVLEVAERVANNSSLAIHVLKEQLRMLGGAHPLPPETFERLQGLRRRVYDSADYREGLAAFREKRPATFGRRSTDDESS